MDSITLIGTVTLVHLLAVISPGPDFVMACRNALLYSRKTGIWTAVGFGLGIAVHISYALFGLAWVVAQSVILFSVIKYLGAAYLIFIGVQSFLSKTKTLEPGVASKQKDIPPMVAIRMGFVTNVLNPKATLFFLSLFTMVVGPEVSVFEMTIISIILIGVTVLWFSLVAVIMTQKRIRQTFERYQGVFNKSLGGLLVALGIKIALMQK
ncbi:MAG: LysE family translocator [Flavobacteriaceae bacterium]